MDTPDLEPLPPDLRHLLDTGPTVAAGPDALRAIVARRDRWRIRTLVGGLALALVAGPAAGYAIGHAGGSASTPVASADHGAQQPSAADANNSSMMAPAPAGVGSALIDGGATAVKPTQLFLRDTAEGIRVRAYLSPFPKFISPVCGTTANQATTAPYRAAVPPTGAVPKTGLKVAPATCLMMPEMVCQPAGMVDAQVSNDQVAGQTMGSVPAATTAALGVLAASVVGANDPTPIATVIARTSAGIDHVVLTVPGSGTDTMTPRNGYVVLARGVAGLVPAKLAPPVARPAKGTTGSGTASGGHTTGAAPMYYPQRGPVGYGFPAGSKVEAFDAANHGVATVALPSWSDDLSPCFAGGYLPGKGTPVPITPTTGPTAPGATGGTSPGAIGGSGGAVSAPGQP